MLVPRNSLLWIELRKKTEVEAGDQQPYDQCSETRLRQLSRCDAEMSLVRGVAYFAPGDAVSRRRVNADQLMQQQIPRYVPLRSA